MTTTSLNPGALSVLTERQAPDVTRARIYGQAGAPVETYRIVETFPHDVDDYTEGLFIYDGHLYEATGEYGKSRIKKSNLATGEVICECTLDRRYFGEGAAALDGKVYRLTYVSTHGFIYRADDLRLEGTFRYPGKGWGLTTDGKHLIMSNGSAAIRSPHLQGRALHRRRGRLQRGRLPQRAAICRRRHLRQCVEDQLPRALLGQDREGQRLGRSRWAEPRSRAACRSARAERHRL
jgi:hypothetical protein